MLSDSIMMLYELSKNEFFKSFSFSEAMIEGGILTINPKDSLTFRQMLSRSLHSDMRTVIRLDSSLSLGADKPRERIER